MSVKEDITVSLSFKMTSSERPPAGFIPSTPEDVPGKPRTVGSQLIDAGAQMLQKFKPINQFEQHVCTWAIYGHDMTRQIETHHYVARVNEDFLQCVVYDSDTSDARLIGVEYIISERLFEALPEEEQKLWHSHSYEIKAGLWVNPGVPELIQKPELRKLAKSYGKFWCTWQFDRGDRLPLGMPALMMSPQPESWGQINEELVKKRDAKYKICTEDKVKSRREIEGPERMHPLADNWKNSGNGWVVEAKEVDMILKAGAPLSTMTLG